MVMMWAAAQFPSHTVRASARSSAMLSGRALNASIHRTAIVPRFGGIQRRTTLTTGPPGSLSSSHRRFYNSGFRNTSVFESPEGVVYTLLGTNAVVFFLWSTADSSAQRMRMTTHFTTSSRHLDAGLYHTLITSVFSHASFSHLLTNSIGLYFFGRETSHLLGPKRFLGLYLASGVIASWASVQEQKLAGRMALNLGASGAVNAITALNILLFPHSTLLIFGIVPIPAWIAGTMFIGRDFYQWVNDAADGIGHFAHLSGAACGALYYAHLRRGMGRFR